MVADSVAHLSAEGRRVFLDAEHFFDGYRADPEFALEVLRAAHDAGAERLVLCDTNGGTLPHEVGRVVPEVINRLPEATFGCHFHNDAGTAVASSLTAVRAGVLQVQGCLNGYGERTGNADLCSVIPNLALKMGYETIPEERLAKLTTVSHLTAELVNRTLDPHTPYVGVSAFTHKAGLHTSALARRADAYEHLPPAAVGNTTRVVVSELAGRSTVLAKARTQGFTLSDQDAQAVVDRIKELEHAGYQFEGADGSFELVVRQAQGWKQGFFSLESYKVFVEHRHGEVQAEATVKLLVGDERRVTTSEGDGPVSALDRALLGRPRRSVPGDRPGASHRLPGARPRLGRRQLGPGAGAGGAQRRRGHLGQRRCPREHHRRLLARPGRRPGGGPDQVGRRRTGRVPRIASAA